VPIDDNQYQRGTLSVTYVIFGRGLGTGHSELNTGVACLRKKANRLVTNDTRTLGSQGRLPTK
jgi:hypothetical protein